MSLGVAWADEVVHQWVEVTQTENGTHYAVDSASITREDHLVYFWIKYNLNPKLMGTALAENHTFEAMDCANNFVMEIKGHTYSPDGQLVGSGENPTPAFTPIAAGSPQQAIQQYVCSPAPGP